MQHEFKILEPEQIKALMERWTDTGLHRVELVAHVLGVIDAELKHSDNPVTDLDELANVIFTCLCGGLRSAHELPF